MQANAMDNFFKEMITANFLNLENEMNIQIQDAFRTLNRQDEKNKLSKKHN